MPSAPPGLWVIVLCPSQVVLGRTPSPGVCPTLALGRGELSRAPWPALGPLKPWGAAPPSSRTPTGPAREPSALWTADTDEVEAGLQRPPRGRSASLDWPPVALGTLPGALRPMRTREVPLPQVAVGDAHRRPGSPVRLWARALCPLGSRGRNPNLGLVGASGAQASPSPLPEPPALLLPRRRQDRPVLHPPGPGTWPRAHLVIRARGGVGPAPRRFRFERRPFPSSPLPSPRPPSSGKLALCFL